MVHEREEKHYIQTRFEFQIFLNLKKHLLFMSQKSQISGMLFNAAPVTVEKARKLRQRLTPAEKLLWINLRNRKFKRLKFRRQHPIDKYIVDFICIEKKLVVEIDGGIHQKSEQIEHDLHRTKELENYGLKIIRFTNDEVLNNIFEVLEKIDIYITENKL